MTMLEISKKIRTGDPCKFHGKKLVRCSALSSLKRLAGIWCEETERTTVMDLNGEIKDYEVPAGLRIQGNVKMKIGKEG